LEREQEQKQEPRPAWQSYMLDWLQIFT